MGRLAGQFRCRRGFGGGSFGAGPAIRTGVTSRSGSGSQPNRGLARQNHAGQLPQLDPNAAFCGVRPHRRRRPCRLSYLCCRRARRVDHRPCHSPTRLWLLRLLAADGLSRRQLSVQPADAALRDRQSYRHRQRRPDSRRLRDGRPRRAACC